jgi:zinc transport system ATP-binding protein
MSLIQCRSLEIGYDGKALLPPVSVAIEPGSFWVLVGRNGSGKSTLVKTLLRLQKPVKGAVEYQPGLKVAYIPQRLHYEPIYPLTAENVVKMGTLRGLNFLALRSLSSDRVRAAMEAVDIWELRGRSFRSLSEGQKQRVLFARALVGEPQLTFMDEPTASMDVVAEREMLNLVNRVGHHFHLAVVMVTHELSITAEFAERVLLIDAPTQQVMAGSAAEVLDSPQFEALYGQDRAAALRTVRRDVETRRAQAAVNP